MGEKKVIKKETNGGGFWSVGFNANSSEQTCELLLLLCWALKQPLLWCFGASPFHLLENRDAPSFGTARFIKEFNAW